MKYTQENTNNYIYIVILRGYSSCMCNPFEISEALDSSAIGTWQFSLYKSTLSIETLIAYPAEQGLIHSK